jgi:diphosphomevalonate decarboxylase
MGELMESEALTLHAMMMTSRPYYLLMRPNTLSIIEEIWAARQEGLPVYFTLDAGANVHMLYPAEAEQKVLDFVNTKLVAYCQQGHYICDEVGSGPKLI